MYGLSIGMNINDIEWAWRLLLFLKPFCIYLWRVARSLWICNASCNVLVLSILIDELAIKEALISRLNFLFIHELLAGVIHTR